jgi:DNA-binding response OmpR family regulator
LRGVCDNLRLESHDVATAIDGDSGFTMARDGGYDLVILDVMLPKLSGFEVCKRLRDAGANVPILVSARGEETDRAISISARTTISPNHFRSVSSGVRSRAPAPSQPAIRLPDE